MRRERIALATGVELDVMLGGDPAAPPILFLHGFPESSRTWRYQQADLSRDHFTIAPDQRGFARSSKPAGTAAYGTDVILADLLALADALGIGGFVLAGHDWGGAVAWAAALKHPDRVERLIIANAPHPYIFQRSLIEDHDQRAASQYINIFRRAGAAEHIRGEGLDSFFAKMFARNLANGTASPEDRARYLDEWSQPGAIKAMLEWYRASAIVVPPPAIGVPLPAWVDQLIPPVTVPTLVIWGLQDQALLPIQIDGLGAVVPDLTLVRVEDAGHFLPWERPQPVTAAIRAFLSRA